MMKILNLFKLLHLQGYLYLLVLGLGWYVHVLYTGNKLSKTITAQQQEQRLAQENTYDLSKSLSLAKQDILARDYSLNDWLYKQSQQEQPQYSTTTSKRNDSSTTASTTRTATTTRTASTSTYKSQYYALAQKSKEIAKEHDLCAVQLTTLQNWARIVSKSKG